MSGGWFYAKNGQRFGPFTFEQFKRLTDSGLLRPDDMVYDEGRQQWLSAGAVAGLFPDAGRRENPASGNDPAPLPASAAEGRPEAAGEPGPAPPEPAEPPRTVPPPARRVKVRSVFWVVSTHVLTTGFAPPALASLAGLAVLNVLPLSPLQGRLILLALQAIGYVGGAFYSLSYIRKTALVRHPLACVRPSVVAFVVLALFGYAVNLWGFMQQQDVSWIEVVVDGIGLAAFYAAVTFAFAWVTRQGFAHMEQAGHWVSAVSVAGPPETTRGARSPTAGQWVSASPVAGPLPDAGLAARLRASPPPTLAQRWGGWRGTLWAVCLLATDAAILHFCVYVWLGLDYSRILWFPTMALAVLVAALAFILAALCTPVCFVLELWGSPDPPPGETVRP